MFRLVKAFRAEIHALGGFWIVIGGIVAALGLFATGMLGIDPNDPEVTLLPLIVVGIGLVWVAIGTLTCYKLMPAVYTGLVLSYLSLVGNLINFNLCGLIILIMVIVQAHRVIGWARRLSRAGIPLNTRPHQITTTLQLPSNLPGAREPPKWPT
jgi:hypothetical protein